MKKLILTIVILIVVAGAVAWLAVNLRAKPKYDKMRHELSEISYSVVEMDADTTALLADVRGNWFESHSETEGPHSKALETVGLRPSVSNLTHVFTYRLPEYSFLSLDQNKKSAAMGMIQATIFPVTIDQSIHVSDDGHLALIRCQKNLVYVFSDEETGLRETMYYVKKKNIEPEDALDKK